MATVTTAGSTWTTTAGAKNVTATPALNDLIVIIAAATGVTTTAVTDNNSDGLGAYTQADTDRVGWSTSGHLSIWVRNALVGSASSTTFTANQASSTGGGLTVLRVSGMTHTGSSAVRSAGGQTTGSGTPAPVLNNTPLSANVIIGSVCCGTNSTTNVTPRTGYTEAVDLGYNTPAAGMEVMFLNSGETSATITWGSSPASAFGSTAIELDTSSPNANVTGVGAAVSAAAGIGTPSGSANVAGVGAAVTVAGGIGTPSGGSGGGGTVARDTTAGFAGASGALVNNNASNAIVVAAETNGNTNTTTSVTYGAASLSFLAYIPSDAQSAGGVALWGKIGGLPTGSNTVTVTGGPPEWCGAATYTGADSFGTAVTNFGSGSSGSAVVTGTTTGGIVVSASSYGTSGTFTATSPASLCWSELINSNSAAGNGMMED